MPRSTPHDFDFLIGQWTVRHRRLKRRLQGCRDWEHFDATGTVQKLPGGMANFDTLVAPTWRPGWVGQTFRVFDPVAARWSLHWLTNEGAGIDPATGHLATPVVGGFDGDRGCFEGQDTLDGRPVRVRFLWERRGPDAARWSQAFSADGGACWETNWVMDFERATRLPAIDAQVVELRRYTLHPGARDRLVELFDRELVEPQEAVGVAVLGQGRELDSADHFTWLRGFPDRGARAAALQRFYDGPVWRAHRAAANATMVDSDDVLLLRPAWPGSGLLHRPGRRGGRVGGTIEVWTWPLAAPADPVLLDEVRARWPVAWAQAGALEQGWYVDDPQPSDWPRLPVREAGPLLVGVAVWPDGAAPPQDPSPRPSGPVHRLRLAPTTGSALHGQGVEAVR